MKGKKSGQKKAKREVTKREEIKWDAGIHEEKNKRSGSNNKIMKPRAEQRKCRGVGKNKWETKKEEENKRRGGNKKIQELRRGEETRAYERRRDENWCK